MAVDEALLWAAEDEPAITLRFYQWSEPTLSLGYFQRYEDRQQHEASHGCAAVRRPSGGGAILHDRELTYSLTIPRGHRLVRHHESLYFAVHAAIAAVLEAHSDLPAGDLHFRLWNKGTVRSTTHTPFLCFQRRSKGDVVVNCAEDDSHHKIIGSAQRRRHGAILQHGSILCGRSIAAPELPGLAELVHMACDRQQLALLLAGEILSRLAPGCGRVGPVKLPSMMQQRAGHLELEKYGCASWLTRC